MPRRLWQYCQDFLLSTKTSVQRNRFRKNQEIRVAEVFLLGKEGEKIGRVSTQQAMMMAAQQGVDLVEISASEFPPVCRLTDFGSFQYRQKKKERDAKKNAKRTEQKSLRFGIRISKGDFENKLGAARKFLEKGHPLRVVLHFRGREIVHDNLGKERLQEFADSLEDVSKADALPKKMGRQLILLLSPLRSGAKKPPTQQQAASKAPSAAPAATPSPPPSATSS